MSKVMELLERIAKGTEATNNRIKALEDAAKGNKESMDSILKRIEATETAIKVRATQPGRSLPGSEEETYKGEKFMYVKAIRYLVNMQNGVPHPEKGCELEAAIMNEATEKAAGDLPSVTRATEMEAGTDSLGGFLVPSEVNEKALIEMIRARAVILAAGATLMPGLVGSPVEIPREESDMTAEWVGEVEAPTSTTPTLGQITFTPHVAAARTILSQRLLRQSSKAAEVIVRRSMTAKIALLFDLAGLRGSGANGQPLGIVNTLDILTSPIGTNGGEVTYDVLVDIMSQPRNVDALTDGTKIAWIMHPKVIAKIEKLKDSNGRPLLMRHSEANIGEKPLQTLLGYPVYTTSQIPTNLTKGSGTALSEIYFGDISTVIVAQWGALEIKVSDTTEDAFKKRQVHVIAFQEGDIGVQQPSRLCVCTDVKTT